MRLNSWCFKLTSWDRTWSNSLGRYYCCRSCTSCLPKSNVGACSHIWEAAPPSPMLRVEGKWESMEKLGKHGTWKSRSYWNCSVMVRSSRYSRFLTHFQEEVCSDFQLFVSCFTCDLSSQQNDTTKNYRQVVTVTSRSSSPWHTKIRTSQVFAPLFFPLFQVHVDHVVVVLPLSLGHSAQRQQEHLNMANERKQGMHCMSLQQARTGSQSVISSFLHLHVHFSIQFSTLQFSVPPPERWTWITVS